MEETKRSLSSKNSMLISSYELQILSPIVMKILVGVVVVALLRLILIEGDGLQTMKEPLSPTPLREETVAFRIDQQTKRMHLSFTVLETVKSSQGECSPTVRSSSQCL